MNSTDTTQRISPRLTGRLKDYREEIKNLLLEDLKGYGAVIFLALFYDLFVNGWNYLLGYEFSHPLSIGAIQFVSITFFGFLWAKKYKQFKDYK